MRLKPLVTLTALIGLPLLLQGCLAAAVTGAAVGTAVGVTGAVIGTTGKVVGAAIPDGDDEKKDKKDKKKQKDED
ncbi:NF038104 family lipoprotein [Asticcacaulis sp. AND118]|uniref:NF038104 family lipoprotein n=1 Tax=Asticcacaulis sp. AND118 TaxID=2840468 RepID=UPI000D2F63B2|nr:NF038104 family lipoprotein [Asticcacaulis sp. AND118]UDF04663.1 NF038104 family lipoprotein [Asticcacaulis sp. AND118]